MNKLHSQKRIAQSFSALLALAVSGTMVSCVDGAFDLDKDFDMTVGVGGQYLAVPLGSTDRITLDQIIEIDEDGDLKLDGNNEYHIIKDGQIDDASTTVEQVTVDGSTNYIDPIEAVNEHSVVTDSVVTTDINQDGDIEASATNIDEALKELGQLTPASPVQVTMRVQLDGNLPYRDFKTDLKIDFPKFLRFANDPNLHQDRDGHYYLTLTVTKNDLVNQTYNYPLQLTGYFFGEAKGQGRTIGDDRSLTINEKVHVSGTSEVTVSGRLESGQYLNIRPSVVLASSKITRVTGIIDPKIDPTTTSIAIEDLPDFLQDEQTQLDVYNPVVVLTANNPLERNVSITGSLWATNDAGNVIDGSKVAIGLGTAGNDRITLVPGRNVIALSRQGHGGPEGATAVQVSDLNNLLRKVPSGIEVKMQPAVDASDYYSVDLGRTYSVSGDYEVDVPLTFGKALSIAYSDSTESFGDDLEDIDFQKAEVTLDAVNTIPLKLEIRNEDVVLRDAYGQVINDVTVNVEGFIDAPKNDVDSTLSQLKVSILETKKGALSRLDKLSFRVTAAPNQDIDGNITLRSTQWMRMKNIKVRVPNGVIIDMN